MRKTILVKDGLMKKLSVIVPCYKAERYIERCLNGLLAQSYKNLEIIVVVDGNLDRSAEIAERYPVKTILFEKNQGASAARNAGLKEATGDYIHFMDVDDTINDGFYEHLMEAITRNDADIACCGIINQKKAYKCQIFSKEKVYTSAADKMKVTWVAKWGYAVRYIFRKSLILKNKLSFEVGRLVEDLPFSFKALYYADKVVTVPQTAYTYCFNDGSSLNPQDPAKKMRCRRDLAHSRELIRNFANEHNLSVPGIGYHPGILVYLARKFCLTTAAAFGYKCF